MEETQHQNPMLPLAQAPTLQDPQVVQLHWLTPQPRWLCRAHTSGLCTSFQMLQVHFHEWAFQLQVLANWSVPES